jgi:MscS family membrane protein
MKSATIILSLMTGMIVTQNANASQLFKSTATDSLVTTATEEKTDPLGRSNPRGTVKGFFQSIANEDYLRGAEYIDFADLTKKANDSVTIILVKKIETVLNKAGNVLPINIINNSAEGATNDGLDASFEEVGSVSLQEKKTPIFLERITNETDQKIWLISGTTAASLLKEFQTNKAHYKEDTFSNRLFTSKWKGAPVTDWLIMIVIAIGSYLIAWLLTILMSWFIRYLWKHFKTNKYSGFLKTLLIPLRLVLAVAIILYFSRLLSIPIVVRQSFSVINVIALWTALFIFMWLLINTLTSFGEERLRENNSFGGLSAISFFRNSAKFMLIIIAILIALDTVGVNVTAGLAALGVGGLALALGAQKTIENIVGGLSVVFDQPVSVGDFCKFGDTLGTVEKIGMRSTRIRTMNRTVVTIPNADFSSRLIENFAKRDLFLFNVKLGLRYETTSDQMRFILVELRKILYAHPKVDQNPARVRFLGYGSDSLQVEIFAYTIVKDWNDYLGVQEDLNLRIGKVIEESGSGFAFPSQTIYLSKDQELSKAKKDEISQKVKQWMENEELQLPEFDTQTIQDLKGNLSYPPEGSVHKAKNGGPEKGK